MSKYLKSNFEKNDFVVKDTFIERGCSAYALVKGNNWEEAEKQAQIIGGNLVTINDVEEYKWIQKNLVFDHKRLKDANYELKIQVNYLCILLVLMTVMKRELCMV